MYTISVAMAAYEGAKYISEQIESILPQLGNKDELIISYQKSEDDTEWIIRKYENSDPRVRVHLCKEKGLFHNFEHALINCKNEVIFISDQDDIWMPEKVDKMLQALIENNVNAVVSSCKIVDSKLKPIKTITKKSHYIKPFEIIIKNIVQGSCLAFERKYLKYILPFPDNIPMYDSYIGLIISTYGKVKYIDDELMLYRQHDNNVTSRTHKRMKYMIDDRYRLVKAYISKIQEVKRIGTL